MFLILIVIISTFLRLYKLDSIPGEMWGDVNEHYKMAKSINDGHFFLSYVFGGDGPLFSYLVTLISKIFGLSFWSIKFTTAIVGILLVIATYYLAQELFKNKRISLISTFLIAISFWSVTFSRQAKPHILVPLLVVLAFYYLLKKKYIFAGIFFGLGMYSQAGFWGAFLFSFYNPLSFLTASIVLLPFILNLNQSFSLSGSFYTEKLGINSGFNFTQAILTVFQNFCKNILSFNIRGDNAFRHTISGQPHLDFISGVFFLIGFLLIIIMVIKKRNIKLLLYFVLPFFIIQIPSIMDIKNPLSIPNMGRMIGVIPFVYISVAYGLNWLMSFFENKVVKNLLLVFILAVIFFINFNDYFYKYTKNLPNENTAFGKIISEEVNKSYENIDTILMVGCCWGQWGQPEPDSVRFLLNNKKIIKFMNMGIDNYNCDLIPMGSRVLIITAPEVNNMAGIGKCFKIKKEYLIKKNNYSIAKFIDVER